MNPSQKRKAVEEALMPFIHGKTLANALILWDEKYAHKPNFALQHYLRELCNDLEIAHMRSRMLQALVSTFSSLQDVRQSRPHVRQPITISPAPVATTGTSPQLAMFTALVDLLIETPGGDASTRVRLYVLENIEKIPLLTQERWAFQGWLNQMAPLTGVTPAVPTLQQVINLTYVALCEYLGPVKADRILRDSVNTVQKQFPSVNVNSLL